MSIRLVLLLALCAWAMPAGAAPAHYIVLHEDAAGQVRVASHALVQMREAPRLAASGHGDGHGSATHKRLAVRAMAGAAKVFETEVEATDVQRYEFAREGGGIDGRHVAAGERHYVLRVPATLGATRVQVDRPAASRGAGAMKRSVMEIDLAALATSSPKAAAAADTFPILANGDPANRVDLLVIGDGYTAAQRAKFVQDATAIMARFFELSPYADYKPLFNVTGLFVPSAQSGASKPACPETPSAPVVAVDTALKARYCAGGLRRAISVDSQATYVAAQGYPDWDQVIVIVNDPEYGGSGGAWAVASLAPEATAIVQHEMGHSFSRLADEYPVAVPGYPGCSDVPGSGKMPCEANVTDVATPLKWQGWLASGTPVPTAEAPGDLRAAGAWEGARYQPSGVMRQCFNGRMRDLAGPFCRVDTAAFVERLYAGGWGAPAAGISNIEPGSMAPAADVAASAGSTVTLQVRVAGPVQGVRATWFVDGAPVKQQVLASGWTATYAHAVASGTHTVRLEVADFAGLTLVPHQGTATWTVRAAVAPRIGVEAAVSGQGRVTSDPAGLDCPGACTASFDEGAVVRLVATPAAGSRFLGWSGACAGTAACTFTANASLSVGAAFGAGNAVAGLGLQPASLDFGGASMLTASDARAITVTNSGAASLQVGAMQASAGFKVDHDCATLAPGASCTARVTFTPGAEGAIAGTLDLSTSAGAASVPLYGVGERSLVTHYYRSILRRAPDDGGKAFWNGEAARMAALGAGANETWYAMAAAFFASGEYTALARDDAGFVADLYATFLGRAPDASGLSYWVGQLQGGLPRPAAIASFTFSGEFGTFAASIFGTAPVRKEIDFVTDFFRGLLGRLPDDNGFLYWRDRFRAAQCAGGNAVALEARAIAFQFAGGGEYAARGRDDGQFVGDLYTALLRRGGDLDGTRAWIDGLRNGTFTRGAVLDAFLGTAEFQSRVSAVASQGCAG